MTAPHTLLRFTTSNIGRRRQDHQMLPSVRLSVTLIQPAEAAGRNEMSFARNTPMTSSSTVLDGGPGFLTERGESVGTRTQNLHCKLQL